MENSQPHASFPSNDWQGATPQDVGMDEAQLALMHAHIHKHMPGLHALLIVRHGYLAFEQYYQGFHHNSYHNVSSVTKSVISILIGAALAQGLLKNLDQHMLDFFPEYAAKISDSCKRAITLRHLLSLKTGFSQKFPDQFWLNPVQSALERPMEQEPDKEFFYDNLSVDILSGILTRLTGKKAAAFAAETLFKRLGIWQTEAARFTWRTDPHGANTWHADALWDEKDGYLWKVNLQGGNTGSFGAHFTAREMAKLGYLYLNKGIWDGEQIVPAAYVSDSIKKHSNGGPPVNAHYGYLWWIEQLEGHHAFFASGFGGKLIYVLPTLDLIIVTTASTERAKKDERQEQTIKALIPRFILPAVLKNVRSDTMQL
jgi:CubicO group peptidase (beta-lactamase class C family)